TRDFLQRSDPPRGLHSFPTRRSSDLHAPHRQRPRGPRRRPRHTRGEGMTAGPQIHAHLHRLADETGIPYDALAAWANQPAPAGIDPELWRQAGRDRILNGTAWNPAQLEALRRRS